MNTDKHGRPFAAPDLILYARKCNDGGWKLHDSQYRKLLHWAMRYNVIHPTISSNPNARHTRRKRIVATKPPQVY